MTYAVVDEAKVFGLDLSHWSGIWDMQKAKAAGVKFIILKAMDGTAEVKYFRENYANAKKAGILVGAYQWLYKSSYISTGKQAREFLNLMKQFPCDLKPTVDFEHTLVGGDPDWNDLYGFVVPFEQEFGKKPMIYTGKYYWQEHGSTNPIWKEYDLWIANYGVVKPNIPLPWTSYTLWQFTDRADGKKYGSPENGELMVDCNYFNGTLAEFYAWAGVSEPVQEEEPISETLPNVPKPVENILYSVVVSVPALSIRAGAGTSYNRVGYKFFGNTVNIMEVNTVGEDVWGRCEQGWVALKYARQYYTNWREQKTIQKKIAWVKPRILTYDGPSVVAGSDAPRANHPTYALDEKWQEWIKSLSYYREDCWRLFSAKDVGPSKGINSNGKLIYIPATWSFNVVETTGNTSGAWTEVKCINVNEAIPVGYTHETHPTLIGIMTTSTKDGNIMVWEYKDGRASAWNSTRDPLISNADTMWLPSEYLETVCTVTTRSLNVRSGYGLHHPIVASYAFKDKLNVYEVVHFGKDVWARSDRGWFALRFNDAYYTNWRIV